MLDDDEPMTERHQNGPHDIIGVIKDRYPGLRPAEQSVASAILNDVKGAVRASNATLAERAGVSQPTVTRFCRSIGCEGVRDFKLKLAQSLAVGDIFLRPAPVDAGPGGLPSYWTSVLGEAHTALADVERQIAPADIEAAAACLAKAGRISTFGIGGSSAALAIEAQVRLFRYGLSVDVCREPYMARMTAATMKKQDVFLAFSATGRSAAVVDAVETAKRYGAQTIAITRPNTPLAHAAGFALAVRINEFPDALTPSATRFGFLAILDLLAAATGYQMGAKARENLRRIKFNIMDRPSGGLEPLGD